MVTRRLRTAVLALLAAGLLTFIALARLSGTERLREGMTVLEAHLVMLSTAEQVPVFVKVSGPPEYHEELWRKNGSPRRHQWEDACQSVTVRFEHGGPGSLPRIADLNRRMKDRTEFGMVWVWRTVAGFAWLWALVLLYRAVFPPKPAVALNSPGAPEAEPPRNQR